MTQHEMGVAGERGRGGTWLRVGESGGSLEKIRPLNLEREKVAFCEEGEKRRLKWLDPCWTMHVDGL